MGIELCLWVLFVTIGDSYIAVLQVNIICSPPGEVSAGVRGQVVGDQGLDGPRDT
jgi:hypothetical protein